MLTDIKRIMTTTRNHSSRMRAARFSGSGGAHTPKDHITQDNIPKDNTSTKDHTPKDNTPLGQSKDNAP